MGQKKISNLHIVTDIKVLIMTSLTNAQIFTKSVHQVLEHWPVLLIARQQGFGGQYSKEKLQWLSDAVVQIFNDNDKVESDELEDFISEAIFNEFDTIADDGSLPGLSTQLCKYYDLCRLGNCEQVMNDVNMMISVTSTNIPIKKVEHLSEDEDEDINSNSFVEKGTDMEVVGMETEERQPKVDADGWEVVTRSRKK